MLWFVPWASTSTASASYNSLQTEVSIVSPLLPDYHLTPSLSHTDDTEYSDQEGLCFSKQLPSPQCADTSISSGCCHGVSSDCLRGRNPWQGCVRGLFNCSSVDAVWAAATAAADRNHISSTESPHRLTYPPESRLQPYVRQSAFLKVITELCLRDRDGIGTQIYGSVVGPRLVGAGRARESSLRERAGAVWHNLSRATLYYTPIYNHFQLASSPPVF